MNLKTIKSALVTQALPDSSEVLIQLQQALAGLPTALYRGDACTEPIIHELIDLVGYDFLIQTLDLDEETFSASHDGLQVSVASRIATKDNILSHLKGCTSCEVLVASDRQLDLWIEKSLKTGIR